MKKYWLPLLLMIVLKAGATHIVGGEIMYKYISQVNGFAKYNVTLLIYIDCDNGNAKAIEDDEKLGVINIFSFNPSTNTFSYYKNLSLQGTRTGPVIISDLNYNCIRNKPKICVSQYTYSLQITLPVNTGGYVISFERCCRNNSIYNIVKPESTGANFWSHIPGVNSIAINSSPVFKSLPPNFLCLNAPLNFMHDAIDADGDSLVYELYTPYSSSNAQGNNVTNPINYKPVTWATSYSLNKQIDGQPTLTINRKTGRLTLTPTLKGQFAVGIKVLEYRKGVLIGETKRDFQFNVSQCVFDVVSSFGVPYYNCTGNNVLFQNKSQGGTIYHWDFGDKSISNDTSGAQNPVYVYKNDGDFTVTLITKTAFCADTSEFEIYVKKNFKVDLGKDTLICGPFNKLLTHQAVNKFYQWNTGAKTAFINVNKEGSYEITVYDAPCEARDTITIINDLSVLDLGPDSVICRDSFVQFTYSGKPGYKSYLWNDGSTTQGVFIPQLTTYWLSILNKNNCPSTDSITFVLYPPPKVNLNDTLFCRGTTVKLDGVNYSFKTILETNYNWSSGETTPQIITSNPGLYTVKVRNRLCTVFDSAQIDYIVTGLEIGNDTFFCGPVKRLLMPRQDYSKYVWQDFAEGSSYLAIAPGKKKVTITTKEGCVESDSVLLTQYPNVDAGLGNDTSICLSSRLELKASDSMVAYLWNTGATAQSIIVKDQGVYSIVVQNMNGCIVADTIEIKEDGNAMPSEMYMPNAFSPNEDNENELYPGNQYRDPGTDYILRVYNRWGGLVFESPKPELQWNGEYQNKKAPPDVYLFYVKYVGCDEKDHWVRGTFNLIR